MMLSLYPLKDILTREVGKKTVKVGLDNQVPEGRIFPTVDDYVDRAVEDQEDVGDVAELGAPVWPVSTHVM